MAARMKKERKGRGSDDRLFTLDVYLTEGPVTEEFARKNRTICRTIEIRGDQTLEDLHNAIFDAFDREEEHMYEFQIGGEGPMDPDARRYVPEAMMEDPDGGGKPAGSVDAAIGSLGLRKGEPFGYWFDFGDDWWHQINVVDIDEKAAPGKHPRVTHRVGESPPQYPDGEEDDDE